MNAMSHIKPLDASVDRDWKRLAFLLEEAENIVRGLKRMESDQPGLNLNFKVPSFGRPILEPLDSSLEPTPLAPPPFLKFVPRRADSSSARSCWETNLSATQEETDDSAESRNLMDLSLREILALDDDTPLSLDQNENTSAVSIVSSATDVASVSSTEENHEKKASRSRQFKDDVWKGRFRELLRFREQTGHVMVPHSYPPSQKLAQWVKRQRYQHQLKQAGRHSTLSDEREEMLNSVGFIWDSHRAVWSYHFQKLEAFALAHGHCCVPLGENKENAGLVTWCKHQRRQYKRYQANIPSTMTAERIRCLEGIGFNWDPRNLSQRKNATFK